MAKKDELCFNSCLVMLESKDFIRGIFWEAGYLDEEGLDCEYCEVGRYKVIKAKKVPVGMIYRCSNLACLKEKTVLSSSVFYNISLKKALILLASFIKNKSIATVISDNNVDEKTVYKFYNFFRKICYDNVPSDIILGGENMEVELDETHLFKRKYNKGNILASEDIWVFGIFERISKKVYLQIVIKRDAETLFNIVSSHVASGTKIYTDGWKGYSKVKKYFATKSVNHKLYFVDPHDPNVHVNNMERTWRTLKEDVRGACNDNYMLHLKEFMFRRIKLSGIFRLDLVTMLKLIKDFE